MEGGQGKLVLQVAIAAAITLWSAAAQAQPGTAAGAFTVNGRHYELRYAYASVQPGAFDAAAEDVRVLLTDVPLPETLHADTTALKSRPGWRPPRTSRRSSPASMRSSPR